MKVIKVIQQLQHYVDEHGKNVEVDFKMVAPENISNDDTMDIDIDFVGEIGTSLLPEKVEIGFDYSFGQKDWSHDWKAQLKDKQIILKDHQYEINADGTETDIERYGKGEINEKKI
jgi:hypothetical protein